MFETYLLTPVVLVRNDCFWLPYCLEAVKNHFEKFVIYDVGSEDGTKKIIEDFVEENKDRISFYVRLLPFVEPKIQGVFRNSQIAEAESEYYLILDADEVWPEKSLDNLIEQTKQMSQTNKHYGVVRRIEVVDNLKQAYGVNHFVPHHRVYHRLAIWKPSPHPGEVALIPQNRNTEFIMEDCVMYHFHNCARSPLDHQVPKRIQRRSQGTYHPGELSEIDIIKELPILEHQIKDYPRHPGL